MCCAQAPHAEVPRQRPQRFLYLCRFCMRGTWPNRGMMPVLFTFVLRMFAQNDAPPPPGSPGHYGTTFVLRDTKGNKKNPKCGVRFEEGGQLFWGAILAYMARMYEKVCWEGSDPPVGWGGHIPPQPQKSSHSWLTSFLRDFICHIFRNPPIF